MPIAIPYTQQVLNLKVIRLGRLLLEMQFIIRDKIYL